MTLFSVLALGLVLPALLLSLSVLLYARATAYVRVRFPTLRRRRVCLLIAHPDDEAMFFAPTLLALTRPEAGNHVRILCLSTGDADGLGETRRKELVKSGLMLGLKAADDVVVLDHPDFPDSMTTHWDESKISTLLSSVLAPGSGRPSIDALLTFDATGVSSHPNHTSLYHGARRFVSTLGQPSPVDLYTLTSLGVARKYSGFLDAVATVLGQQQQQKQEEEQKKQNRGSGKADDTQQSGTGSPDVLVAFSDLFGGGRESAATARRAMTAAHLSQMRWFRWGWITLSRYMVINELKLERVTA